MTTEYRGLYPYRGRWPGLNEDGLDLENAGLFTLFHALPDSEKRNPARRVQVAQFWNQVREPRNSEALKNMKQGDSSAGLPDEDSAWGRWEDDSEEWLQKINATLS